MSSVGVRAVISRKTQQRRVGATSCHVWCLALDSSPVTTIIGVKDPQKYVEEA